MTAQHEGEDVWRSKVAVPKKKKSRSRRDMRRAHHKVLDKANFADCPSCGEPKLSHTVCLSCGEYKGRKIVEVKEEETSGS